MKWADHAAQLSDIKVRLLWSLRLKLLHKTTTTGQKWQKLDVALYMVHNEHMRLRQQSRPSWFTGITALWLYVSVHKTGFSWHACLCKTEPGTPSGQQSRSVPWPLTYGHQNLISVSFTPSGHLFQIWRNSLLVFLIGFIHKNGMYGETDSPQT